MVSVFIDQVEHTWTFGFNLAAFIEQAIFITLLAMDYSTGSLHIILTTSRI